MFSLHVINSHLVLIKVHASDADHITEILRAAGRTSILGGMSHPALRSVMISSNHQCNYAKRCCIYLTFRAAISWAYHLLHRADSQHALAQPVVVTTLCYHTGVMLDEL